MCKHRWNQHYVDSITGEHYKHFQPSLYRPLDSRNSSGKCHKILFRIQTGPWSFRSHLHRNEKSDTPLCQNCLMEETVARCILQYPVCEQERSILFSHVRKAHAQFSLVNLLTDPRTMPHVVEFVMFTGKRIKY